MTTAMSYLKSTRLVSGALLLATVLVGSLWAEVGGRKEDPFTGCVAKAVLETHDASHKLNVKIPGAIVKLFSGSGKSEPLDLTVKARTKMSTESSRRESPHSSLPPARDNTARNGQPSM
jgi:hypothetical protein